MSMKMRINNGESLEITDDNQTIVSKGIAEEINLSVKELTQCVSDVNECLTRHRQPNLTIKDSVR